MASSPANSLVDIRPVTEINDDVIRLDDIFTGLEENQNEIVEKSPHPGKTRTFDFPSLKKIADRFALPWSPILTSARCEVIRSSYRIPISNVHSRIEEYCKQEHPDLFANESVSIVLTRNMDTIYSPKEKSMALIPTKIWFNEQQTRFTVRVETDYATHDIEGYILQNQKVPVLRRIMRKGETINASDIELMLMPLRDIGRAQILSPNDVLGKAINVGQINPFKAIYAHEIERQFLVYTEDTLRMFPILSDTHESIPGTALANGMRDDIIPVRNELTDGVHEGHVIDDARVDILETPADFFPIPHMTEAIMPSKE